MYVILQFSALYNLNFHGRLITFQCDNILNLSHSKKWRSVNNLSKHYMLSIQPLCGLCGNEELTTICIGSTISLHSYIIGVYNIYIYVVLAYMCAYRWIYLCSVYVYVYNMRICVCYVYLSMYVCMYVCIYLSIYLSIYIYILWLFWIGNA